MNTYQRPTVFPVQLAVSQRQLLNDLLLVRVCWERPSYSRGPVKDKVHQISVNAAHRWRGILIQLALQTVTPVVQWFEGVLSWQEVGWSGCVFHNDNNCTHMILLLARPKKITCPYYVAFSFFFFFFFFFWLLAWSTFSLPVRCCCCQTYPCNFF